MKLLLAVLLFAVTASAQTLTHYGSRQDALGDTNSRNAGSATMTTPRPLKSLPSPLRWLNSTGSKLAIRLLFTAGGHDLQSDLRRHGSRGLYRSKNGSACSGRPAD